jgi:hypothetical protein
MMMAKIIDFFLLSFFRNIYCCAACRQVEKVLSAECYCYYIVQFMLPSNSLCHDGIDSANRVQYVYFRSVAKTLKLAVKTMAL